MLSLKLISAGLLDEYIENFDKELFDRFAALKESVLTTKTYSFYTSVSAVFSSKIEGEEVELDSYVKHKKLKVKFNPDYTQKIDDLYSAYIFAQSHPLNEKTLCEAYELLSKNLLHSSRQGAYRTGNMFVMTPDGKIEYVAPSPYKLKYELTDFFEDLDVLLNNEISFAETFFFASFLHLVFVKIHPFEDGNGRTARLLEKWFLAEKLGKQAWYLQSEKFYYDFHQEYYSTLRTLGLEYETLNYEKALPFLKLLPELLKRIEI